MIQRENSSSFYSVPLVSSWDFLNAFVEIDSRIPGCHVYANVLVHFTISWPIPSVCLLSCLLRVMEAGIKKMCRLKELKSKKQFQKAWGFPSINDTLGERLHWKINKHSTAWFSVLVLPTGDWSMSNISNSQSKAKIFTFI